MNKIAQQLYKTKKKKLLVQKILNNHTTVVSPPKSNKTHKYFLPHARLNRGQRRFCHCIMKARITKPEGGHYGFCQGVAKNDWAKAKLMRNKTKARQYYFTINKTNCIMNYDYNDYSLQEVQSFAAEKRLPLFELDESGNKKYYPKDRLVQLLVTNYVKKHKTTEQPEKKTKKLKLKQ